MLASLSERIRNPLKVGLGRSIDGDVTVLPVICSSMLDKKSIAIELFSQDVLQVTW